MAHKSWTFELRENDGHGGEPSLFAPRPRTHTVELQHNYWTTRRTIYLDEQLVPLSEIKSYGVYGKGSDDLFRVDGHDCVVNIRSNGVVYNYDLAVDGLSVQSGKPLDIAPEVFQVSPGTSDQLPTWAWIFLVLCPIVSIAAIFAGIFLGSLVSTNSPARNLRLAHLIITPIVVQAIYAIIIASKEPGIDASGRVAKCAMVVGRTGLLVMLALGVLTVLLH